MSPQRERALARGLGVSAAPEGEFVLSLVDPGGLLDLSEGWFELVSGDLGSVLFIDADPQVEGLVEVAPGVVGCLLVQRTWVGGEVEGVAEPLGPSSSSAEVSTRLAWTRTRLLRMALLRSWILVLSRRPVGGEVDQPGFACVELGEPFGQLDVDLAREPLWVGHGGAELFTDVARLRGDRQPGRHVRHHHRDSVQRGRLAPRRLELERRRHSGWHA